MFQGARDAVWNLLPLPLAALPLPPDPAAPLDPSSSASWLYGAASTTDRNSHRDAAGEDKSVYYGCSFVSTSRDGQTLLWALPPLQRRKDSGKGGGPSSRRPAAAARSSHASDTWALCTGSEEEGWDESDTGPENVAWEFRTLVQAGTARPTTASGRPATARPTAAVNCTVAGATATANSNSRRFKSEGASAPTLPVSPLFQLCDTGPALLASDAWVLDGRRASAVHIPLYEGHTSNDEQGVEEGEAGVVAVVAAGAADGSVKVWRVVGVRLRHGSVQGQQQQRQWQKHFTHQLELCKHRVRMDHEQARGGCMVLPQGKGVMSVRFGLVPVTVGDGLGQSSSQRGNARTGGSLNAVINDEAALMVHKRRMVLYSGSLSEVKVSGVVFCLCKI